jgi:alkylation response protein AidB-like acyl-CoA dehydrogenase
VSVDSPATTPVYNPPLRAETEEQAHWLNVAREFNEQVVAPRAMELDAQIDPRDCWSWKIVEAADAAGLRTLTLAPEYGGAGVDTLTAAMVVQELCRGDLGVGVVMAQNLKFIQMLQAGGNEDQKSRYLPLIAGDPRCIIATAGTEPKRGSDNLTPYSGLDSPFSTTAVKADGGWVLNGLKQFISNGPTSRVYFVLAQTTPGVPVTEGSTMFVFERDTEGFSIGKVHNKLGERLVNNSELVFRDCFIPDADVFGEPGGAFPMLAKLIPSSNVFAGASALGCAEACYDRAVVWTRDRVQGGKRLIEHDTVAVKLAEMRMLLDVARAYIRNAAWACDHREAWDVRMSCYPKVYASQIAWQIATTAMELHGGYGFMRESGNDMEKLLRDASTFLHSDGANLALLLRAGKLIRGEAFAPIPL